MQRTWDRAGNRYGADKLPQWFGILALFIVCLRQWLDNHAMFFEHGAQSLLKVRCIFASASLGLSNDHEQTFKWQFQVTMTSEQSLLKKDYPPWN